MDLPRAELEDRSSLLTRMSNFNLPQRPGAGWRQNAEWFEASKLPNGL